MFTDGHYRDWKNSGSGFEGYAISNYLAELITKQT